MAKKEAFIEVVIDVDEPIELSDFVTAFTSVASQYKRYMREAHPDLKDDATIYVREVRPGSIIGKLWPYAASLIGVMDQAMIVQQFIDLYGTRLLRYFQKDGRLEDTTNTELKDIMEQIAAVANAKRGLGELRAVVEYEDGTREVKTSIKFEASEAKRAVREIERHREEMTGVGAADRQRVLMAFKRSDIGDATVGKKSGERVVIEEITEKDRPLIYGSSLAEDQIKDQMRNTGENIYHKGFVVDVKITTKNGKPIAYTVTNLHQIIDLEED